MISSNSPAALYHCPCESPACRAESSLLAYQPLARLYFCEECDSVRCDSCVLQEVASYYCPNCLFEVPSASVRAEKNRCARNCFLCPCCSNTLSVVASDPTDRNVAQQPASAQASIGEAPFYLSCLTCRWDSESIGITFEKPTGLAGQFQRLEESSPAIQEYDKISNHVEPYLKSGLAQLNATHAGAKTSSRHPGHLPSRKSLPTSAIAAAARALRSSSSMISKDIPSSIGSASKFNSLHNLALLNAKSNAAVHGLSKFNASAAPSMRDHLKPYRTTVQAETTVNKPPVPMDQERDKIKYKREMRILENVSSAVQVKGAKKQSWSIPWHSPADPADLLPLRMPLKSKMTKRCHACRHIVVKPDPKASSLKYKICLVASNYLPAIDVHRRIPLSLAGRLSAVGSTAATSASAQGSRRQSGRPTSSKAATESLVEVGSDDDVEPLRPGRAYSYHITFSNPLPESIEVFLEIVEPDDDGFEPEKAAPDESQSKATVGQNIKPEGEGSNKSQTLPHTDKPTFSVSLPSKRFSVGAFAEAWEYEGLDDENDDFLGAPDGTSGDSAHAGRRRRHGAGIIAKKANKTVIQLDLLVGKDAKGTIRTPLLVTYTYMADETTGTKDATWTLDKTDPESSAASNLRQFSFWTTILLGNVVPRTAAGVPPVPQLSTAHAPTTPGVSDPEDTPAMAAKAIPNASTLTT